LRRLAYTGLYYLVARHLPRSFTPYSLGAGRIRYWLCRQIFAECGRSVNVEHGAYFGSGRGIQIGDNSGIGVDAFVGSPVEIGSNVMMGPDVIILTSNHRFRDLKSPMLAQGSKVDAVRIEDDVWIGTRAIILPGTTVGRGAIIGAGSVVTRDVAAYSIVGGNPARVIGNRLEGRG
jgi:maltose O-acetyltransferase